MSRMTGFLCALLFSVFLVTGCGSQGAPDVAGSDVLVGTQCFSSSECDDGIPCTRDRCNRGFCVNEEIVCEDGDPCTDDSCFEGECRFDRRSNCCDSDDDCDDGDPCTKGDRCAQDTKTCVIAAPIEPCCRGAGDCDDGDICTTDICQTNLLCFHKWEITGLNSGRCCNQDSDCGDQDHCTSDVCRITDGSTTPPRGRCQHEVRCCELDEDCVAGDSPCMAGDCVIESGQAEGECGYAWIDGCCVAVGDCPEVACMNVSCIGSECVYSRIPGCCTADAECGSDQCLFCEKGGSVAGTCELRADQNCCKTTVYPADSAQSGFAGVTFTPLTAPGYAAQPAWHVTTRRAYSGPYSLFFGDEETGMCRGDGTLKTGGRAITPSIPLMQTKNPVLQFRMWKNTNEISRFQDVVSVYVVSASGETRVFSTKDLAVFNSGDQFVLFPSAPLSLENWKGQSVSLVFEYDSAVAAEASWEGVYVDDIVVSGTCE